MPGAAVGDIHGDMSKAINALKFAGVLKDDNDRPTWVGGNTVVVQLGDVLDRGDNEIGAHPTLPEYYAMVLQFCASNTRVLS